jgi:streptomycin 6-kinase
MQYGVRENTMKIFIPENLHNQARNFGDEGIDWLNRLPERIARLERAWDIRVGPAFDHDGCVSWVAPVQCSDGTEAILKIGIPHDEARFEANALRFLDGQGAARLLNVSEDGFSLLLERCVPGTSLWSLEDVERDAVAASVLPRLWRTPAPDAPFVALTDVMRRWSEEIPQEAADKGYTPEQAAQAVAWGQELAASQPQSIFLHGDFHPGNILAAEREPWLVIDPKAMVGDPAFDLAQWLYNASRDMMDTDEAVTLLQDKVERFAQELGLSPARIAGWTFVKALGWDCGSSVVSLFQKVAEPWYQESRS